MKLRTKDGNDGDHVVCELGLWTGVIIVFIHDDLHSDPRKKVLDEIVCEAAESVFVGNAHLSYLALHAEFQKRQEPLALEVDAAGNIRDDLVSGVLVLQLLDLIGQVGLLLLGGHPGVYNPESLSSVMPCAVSWPQPVPRSATYQASEEISPASVQLQKLTEA